MAKSRIGLAQVLMRKTVDDDPGWFALQPLDDPALDLRHGIGLIAVGDRDRNTWISLQVASLARTWLGEEYDPVPFRPDPQRDTMRPAIGKRGGQVDEVCALEEFADGIRELRHPPSSCRQSASASGGGVPSNW